MTQVIHQHSNFSSKFLYFFLSPNKREKKIPFSPYFFFLRIFFFHFFFPPNFLMIERSLSCQRGLWLIKSKSKLYNVRAPYGHRRHTATLSEPRDIPENFKQCNPRHYSVLPKSRADLFPYSPEVWHGIPFGCAFKQCESSHDSYGIERSSMKVVAQEHHPDLTSLETSRGIVTRGF